MLKNYAEESDWQGEVKAAVRVVTLELSPGVHWIPPPEYRTVFTCRKCRCPYASFIDAVPGKPMKRSARCGYCGHHQLIFD